MQSIGCMFGIDARLSFTSYGLSTVTKSSPKR